MKTVFIDITKGKYKFVGEFPFDVDCKVDEFVDLTEYNPFSDDDIFKVMNVIHLPNEQKKVVELKLTFTTELKREY